MNPVAYQWLSQPELSLWASAQTNAALPNGDSAGFASLMLDRLGLPKHPDPPKNWDTLLALFHAITNTAPHEAILDAGAEQYSSFLPALRSVGYSDLLGLNLCFEGCTQRNGVRFCHGDITGTGLPTGSIAFISCLSVIEHGVDVGRFLAESSRLLQKGGLLSLSFDYWQDPVDTRGQQAYGAPIRILTREDVSDLLREAADCGFINQAFDWTCEQRVVHWLRFDLRYTFANVLLKKG